MLRINTLHTNAQHLNQPALLQSLCYYLASLLTLESLTALSFASEIAIYQTQTCEERRIHDQRIRLRSGALLC